MKLLSVVSPTCIQLPGSAYSASSPQKQTPTAAKAMGKGELIDLCDVDTPPSQRKRGRPPSSAHKSSKKKVGTVASRLDNNISASKHPVIAGQWSLHSFFGAATAATASSKMMMKKQEGDDGQPMPTAIQEEKKMVSDELKKSIDNAEDVDDDNDTKPEGVGYII